MKNIQYTDPIVINKIISKVQVCHVAFVDGDKPYVLPFNFGYTDNILYLHTALTGRKIDILKKNNNVCISFETDSVLNIRHEEVACSYSMKFKSVIMSGKLHFIEEVEKKKEAMNIIMKQYCGRNDFSYNLPAICGVLVMWLEANEVTARIRE